MDNTTMANLADVAALIRNPEKLVEVLMAHNPHDEVVDIEGFKEVCEVFGLTAKCVEELWEGMNTAKAEADAKTEGGVMFTYACALISVVMSLKVGKCKDCEHRPGRDDIGEPASKMIQ